MIDHVLRYTLPAAYSLLPEPMDSPAASALLLAIGLQESEFLARRQQHGPARGFWQFERAGVIGVVTHPRSAPHVEHVFRYLRYGETVGNVSLLHPLLEHQDTIAACFARLLLWTLVEPLPRQDEPERGWAQYLAAWRPGTPRPVEWSANFQEAWERVSTP